MGAPSTCCRVQAGRKAEHRLEQQAADVKPRFFIFVTVVVLISDLTDGSQIVPVPVPGAGGGAGQPAQPAALPGGAGQQAGGGAGAGCAPVQGGGLRHGPLARQQGNIQHVDSNSHD